MKRENSVRGENMWCAFLQNQIKERREINEWICKLERVIPNCFEFLCFVCSTSSQ